ncbi:MAG: hypothetical protein U5J83_17810 [Bryobacterales bacterium]|nr:hypothetical protein [Bryobacterales bacterium]
MPLPDEPASLGLVDATTGKFQPVAETKGWNFQQGAMLHWHPADANRYFIHNNRRGPGDVFGEVRDLATGESRRLPRAVNGVARNHPYALCLNYGRLTRMRPVVGYPGLEDSTSKDPHPANDGAWVMDINSGEQHLAVSIDAVFQQIVRSHPWVEGQHMWFNHVVFNPSATRFFFLARVWTLGENRELESAMFTANRDGSELREVVPFGKSVSHFEWRNDTQILATFKHDAEDRQHVLFTDGKPDYQVVAREYFVGDGHCSFAPDGDWIVTDRNNGKTLAKELRIYSLSARKGHYIGSFPMREKKYMGGDLRCDLHPRWSRDRKQICFDALHPKDGTRQLHIATLPALTALG